MSCPYCLAFNPSAPGPAKRAPGVTQRTPQQLLQKGETLVQAYWEFAEGKDRWLGFSPAVSGLLEAAYQNWLQNPGQTQVRAGGFLYNVDYASMLESGQHQSQRIRRVGVTVDGEGEGHRPGLCSVDPSLWHEVQRKLQDLLQERDGLIAMLKAGPKASGDSVLPKAEEEEPQGALAEEIRKLWRQCQRQEEELCRLREADGCLQKLAALLEGAVLPGRLARANVPASEKAGDACLAWVRTVEGSEACVDLLDAMPGAVQSSRPDSSLKLPIASLKPERQQALLARPGSKVQWADAEGEKEGVVCGGTWAEPLAAADSMPGDIDVLVSSGCCQQVPLSRLRLRDSQRSCHPHSFRVGDLVRARSNDADRASQERDAAPGALGMVVRADEAVDATETSGRNTIVRFAHAAQGFVDVAFGCREEQLCLDEAADIVRPGTAVRLKGLPSVGVVFALHGDATAIVDFLDSWGLPCNAADLEVVDNPPAVEVELIHVLAECLTG
eukprot:TRINITY_DN373_c0_g1_i2.p1 TRINITY_DN373_c0_g1~~TRINITY_DN373_c0_g1_i2.p1  ORF type:complete len:499 (-),score=120.47 TRINITY_DN373_c0_g1_i2:79-1575(-)